MATMIDVLDGETRVAEVARMLDGVEQTPAGLALASDMLRRGTR